MIADLLSPQVNSLIAIVSLLASVFIYMHQRSRKILVFEQIDMSRSHNTIPDAPVSTSSEYRVTHLMVSNAGNQPILSTDFERPLTVHFGEAAEVRDVTIGMTKPKQLQVRTELVGDSITIFPLLLNPKDSFELVALVSGYSHSAHVDGRIVGVPHIVYRQAQRIETNRWFEVATKPLLRLPTLRARKNPWIAGVLGGIFGGFGLGIYFRSILDFLLPLGVASLIIIWGNDVGSLLSVLISGAYGSLRAYTSNLRLA